MNIISDREKLIEYLDTHCIDSYGEIQTWKVADFIIKDRKNIVEPLASIFKGSVFLYGLKNAIFSTLKRAGIEE